MRHPVTMLRLTSPAAFVIACLLASIHGFSAYAGDPQPRCAASAALLPDDGFFGYLYEVTATCDHLARTLIIGAGASPINMPDYLGTGTDGVVCFNTDTCTGVARMACLRPGTYKVDAEVAGEFSDTAINNLVYWHSFQFPAGGLAVPSIAELTVAFQPDPMHSDKVQATVTYSLPQQYFVHVLGATVSTHAQTNFVISDLLPLSGQWIIPRALESGSTLFVYPIGCNADENMVGPGTSKLQVMVPRLSSDYQVVAQNLASGAAPEAKSIAGAASASIPLGARFTLALQKSIPSQAPQSITARYGLGTVHLTTAQADPSLYPSAALLEFDANSSASVQSQLFQAVHLGSQVVVITPDDRSVPRQIVTVNIIRPDHLGSTHSTIALNGDSFDLDAKIVDWADRRGIPPQLIKGIIDRESPRFKPLEWRYEPLTTDWDGFSPLGQNRRSSAIFAPYRMEYDAAHSRGFLLVDTEDVHPRASFYLVSGTNTPHAACSPPSTCVADGQQSVTAYAIVSQNEFWQHWISNLTNQRKQALLTSSLIQQTLSWPAETTLAASYGLMQVLFEETFQSYGSAGINGRRRPYYFFDTPANVRADAGSIPTGTGVFVYHYRYENNLDDSREYSPRYAQPADLDDAYQNGLMGYNGSFCTSPNCYGPDTIRRTSNYLPVTATPIFP